MKKDLEKVKKTKRLKYIWPVILIVLIVFMSALVLIGRRPRYYAPLRLNDKNLISPYLTGQILPTVYNNSQLGKPFELVITQDGLNDIVARLPQPISLHNLNLTDPQVVLSPMQITLMATVKIKPLNPILTIELNPYINQHGLLNLCVNRVMLGSADITTIAISIGNKAYSNWLYSTGTDPNNIAAQICRSLLNYEPFEPTFEVGDTTLRITKFDTVAKKITVLLTPVPD